MNRDHPHSATDASCPKVDLGSVAPQQAYSFFASHGSNQHQQRDMEFIFHAAHAPMKAVYAQLIRAATSAWLVCSSARRVVPKVLVWS
jgi:hypothetical protein